jgi:hypothetical protein
MRILRTIGMAIAFALFASAGSARAEVQKFLSVCDRKLCPYFHIVLMPPHGWVVDAEATRINRLQIIVPAGKNFATAPALIYVQVLYHRDKQQSLADFARVSNERWRAHVKGAKISELPAVTRTNGKPGFLRFAYQNPSKMQQAYEFGAFGIDSDKDGNEFVLDVVMTGADKTALDRAEKDYIAFLTAH